MRGRRRLSSHAVWVLSASNRTMGVYRSIAFLRIPFLRIPLHDRERIYQEVGSAQGRGFEGFVYLMIMDVFAV